MEAESETRKPIRLKKHDIHTEAVFFGKASHIRYKQFGRRRRKGRNWLSKNVRLHRKLRSRFCNTLSRRQGKKFHWRLDWRPDWKLWKHKKDEETDD